MRSTAGIRPRLFAILVPAILAVAVACAGGDEEATPAATSTGTPAADVGAAEGTPDAAETTPTAQTAQTAPATETASATLTATATAETPSGGAVATEETLEALRRNLLSSLTMDVDAETARRALESLEVTAVELPGERPLWVVATSGPGLYELPEDRRHLVAVYERLADGWAEIAQIALASAPTFTEIELLAPSHAGAAWVGIHGVVGAHGGTFELLRFDGLSLESALWWFSPSPGAATIVDLDGREPPEVVLNATDPYVYCYACGVRAWDEVIYRWADGHLAEVTLTGVAHPDPRVADLSEVAATYARAHLWRDARDTIDEARSLAGEVGPDDDLFWVHLAITRVADQRLAEAGAEPQPFMTHVLAGEYEAAVDLMRAHPPAEALSPTGPLIEGTVAADGWDDATASWILDYTERAIEVRPDLAAAHAVRAFGLLVQDPGAWAAALDAMVEAERLAPEDPFYRAAVEYLLEQNGGALG